MLTTFFYQRGKPLETNLTRAQMLAAMNDKEAFLWADFEDPNEFESDALVEIFNFHPLAVEDCISDISQPKVDDYEEYLFLVMHGVRMSPQGELVTVELDIFLGKNYVVTFHKETLKSIEKTRDTVLRKTEGVMGRGPDMMVHTILDQLVDYYLPMLDQYDDKMDGLEEAIFNNPPRDYLATVLQVKRDVIHLRRILSPQRETINFLTRNQTHFIRPKNLIYFRDIYDHLFRIYGIVEGYQEMITGILQAYFSYSSNRLNEVIKRLTVLATLTMPAVTIASIYGMNFKNMPELEWMYGYYLSWGSIIFVTGVMLIWMKFKKWI
ncbi:MAG: magnesium/cobalt transporter CorA [Candidatus Omnitrophica bacterium]|nr:magnesium/cobalt transporter CorA [Candidatus Omnitrophota bacterium]MDD5672492.1 magnesium/cobalt transporter CorA [Candidatus Omnitrophota bacterium]